MKIIINFLLRDPIFPVIIIDRKRLYAARNIYQLTHSVVRCSLQKNEGYLKMIDVSGEEFWYEPITSVIAPGFWVKRWTKKKIIDLYNRYCKDSELEYKKSFQNIRLDMVIGEICRLLPCRTE